MKHVSKTNCGIRPIRDLGHRMNSYRNLLREHPNWQTKLRKSIKAVGNTVELFPYAMEWILDLKARGYHVYILSNYSENMLDQTKDKLKFLPLMDGVVFSYKIKKMKPDPEIL